MTRSLTITRRSIRNLRSLVSCALITACGTGTSGDAAAPAVLLSAADITAATTADVGSTVVVSGALDPADVRRVRAQVAGTMREMLVDRGTKVSRGQLLARIEALGVTTLAEGAKANVASAEAGLLVARQRLDGARKLLDAGATSQIEYKTTQANFDAATAQVAAARAVQAGTGEAAARASILSPIDGWVSERAVEAGESVKSDDPVLTVVDPRTLELKGQVGATDAARVRAGQKVTFTLDALPNQEFRGTLARVDPVANAATRQVGVFARLPNAAGRIVAGQFAHGRIHTGAEVRAIVVPAAAVRGSEKERYVLVVDDAVVRRRVVVTGAHDDDTGTVAITSGLRAGERVISTAGVALADGTKVTTAKGQ